MQNNQDSQDSTGEIIYTKAVGTNLVTKVFRHVHNNTYDWEIDLLKPQKEVVEKITLTQKDLESTNNLGYRNNFYLCFTIMDALFDSSNNSLIFLIDMFGEVFLYQYYLEKTSFKKIKTEKRLVTTYKINSRDLDYKTAKDGHIYKKDKELILYMSINDSDKVFTLNSETKQLSSTLFSIMPFTDKEIISDAEHYDIMLKGNLENKDKVIQILSEVIKKTTYHINTWQYDYYIEDGFAQAYLQSRKERLGLVYFFLTVNNVKKIFAYNTPQREWIITDYQEKPVLPQESKIEKFIKASSLN